MRFTLPRQKIDPKLAAFGAKKVREHQIEVPRARLSLLKQLVSVSEEILRDGLPKRFIIKRLGGGLGSGVFLRLGAKKIPRGSLIAPYSGEVFLLPQAQENNSDYTFSLVLDLYLNREEQKEWDPTNRYHPRRKYSIDLEARDQGNFTRFINHSEQPNIEARFVRVPKNDLGLAPSPFEVMYVAKKAIHPGEQLLICYDGEDNSYWGPLKIKPLPMTPKTFQVDASGKLISRDKKALR